MNPTRIAFGVLFTFVVSLFVPRNLWGQQNRKEVDPIACMSEILRTSYSKNMSINYTNSWIDIVDKASYEQNKNEVNAAAEKTLGWKASANWSEFAEKRNQFHQQRGEQTAYSQALQEVFNGLSDRAFDTIDNCINKTAITSPNLYFVVSKNTKEDVQIKIYWQTLPGPKPAPFHIEGSSLQHAHRTDSRPATFIDRNNPWRAPVWSEDPGDGEFFRKGVEFAGTSFYTVTLKRDDPNKAVVGSIWGPNFDQVFFNIEPPAKAIQRQTKCSVSAKELKQSTDQGPYFIGFPPGGSEGFPLDCWNLEPGKTVRITWSGKIEPPNFFGEDKDGKRFLANSPGVNYRATLVLLLRDAGLEEIQAPMVLYDKDQPALDDRPISSSIDIQVPPSGAILAKLAVNNSSMTPNTLGPLRLSDDFRLTIETLGQRQD